MVSKPSQSLVLQTTSFIAYKGLLEQEQHGWTSARSRLLGPFVLRVAGFVVHSTLQVRGSR